MRKPRKVTTGRPTRLVLPMLVIAFVTSAAHTNCAAPRPLPDLPIVFVVDSNADQVLDQVDIDDAFLQCGTGCNLYFPAGVYFDVQIEIGSFPDGFAMYGEGAGKTVLRSRIFTDEDWIETVIVGNNAPDGVIIQDMSLDGRKFDQDPLTLFVPPFEPPWQLVKPLNTLSHQGIHSRALNNDPRQNGIIRRVEVFNYAIRGIGIRNSPGWVVADNVIHDIGCHVVDMPCGLAWEQLPDTNPSTPGRKVDGFGIQVLAASDNVVIKGNRVLAASKIGIEVFGENSCDATSVAARYTRIVDNTVSLSAGGITLNGACQTSVIGNVVSNSVATGGEAFNLGKGFTCTGDTGHGLVLRDNVSIGHQASGYQIACIGGDITFSNNVAANNCRGNLGTSDFEFSRPAGASTNGALLRITGATNQMESACFAAMYIRNWEDVSVEDSTLEGGRLHGLRLEAGSGIDVRRTTITGKGNPHGVIMGIGLADTYVHPSVDVTGYAAEVAFHAGTLNDGDDVAYCPLESPMPAGCDP